MQAAEALSYELTQSTERRIKRGTEYFAVQLAFNFFPACVLKDIRMRQVLQSGGAYVSLGSCFLPFDCFVSVIRDDTRREHGAAERR